MRSDVAAQPLRKPLDIDGAAGARRHPVRSRAISSAFKVPTLVDRPDLVTQNTPWFAPDLDEGFAGKQRADIARDRQHDDSSAVASAGVV